MKAMLVLEKDPVKHRVVEHLSPQGFVFIHYTNPLKAMDNLEEVDPEIVLFSAYDYPRHWKPFLQLFRQMDREEQRRPFILLRGDFFTEDEVSKAGILGVNAVVREDLSTPDDLMLLEDILARYSVIDDKRLDRRYGIASRQHIEFMFTHPDSMKIVTGNVEDLSMGGLLFRPDDTSLSLDLKIGSDVELCTLSIDEHYFELSARIRHNSGPLALKFLDLPEACRKELMELFETHRQKALKRAL